VTKKPVVPPRHEVGGPTGPLNVEAPTRRSKLGRGRLKGPRRSQTLVPPPYNGTADAGPPGSITGPRLGGTGPLQTVSSAKARV